MKVFQNHWLLVRIYSNYRCLWCLPSSSVPVRKRSVTCLMTSFRTSISIKSRDYYYTVRFTTQLTCMLSKGLYPLLRTLRKHLPHDPEWLCMRRTPCPPCYLGFAHEHYAHKLHQPTSLGTGNQNLWLNQKTESSQVEGSLSCFRAKFFIYFTCAPAPSATLQMTPYSWHRWSFGSSNPIICCYTCITQYIYIT